MRAKGRFMVVIKGYEFNMTQIGHNKYENHITSGKEAQKLLLLIRGMRNLAIQHCIVFIRNINLLQINFLSVIQF